MTIGVDNQVTSAISELRHVYSLLEFAVFFKTKCVYRAFLTETALRSHGTGQISDWLKIRLFRCSIHTEPP